jgi:acyl carrier protein
MCFSSVAPLVGSPGQGNYAAANAMLDALAHDRAARGRAATSINWGPWSEIGLAAANENRGARIARQGLDSISPKEGRLLLRSLFADLPVQVAAMRIDAEQWTQCVPGAARNSLFAGMRTKSGKQESGESTGLLQQLRNVSANDAHLLMRTHITGNISAILRLDITNIPPDKPVRSLGLDSLMALELRNRLERSLKLKLSSSLIWNYPTPDILAKHLLQKLEIGSASTSVESAPPNLKTAPPTETATKARAASAEDLLEAELFGAQAFLRKS